MGLYRYWRMCQVLIGKVLTDTRSASVAVELWSMGITSQAPAGADGFTVVSVVQF